MRALAIGVLLAAVAAPLVGAHGGSHVSFQQKIAGDSLVRFGLDAPVVQADTPLPIVIELANATTGNPVTGRETTASTTGSGVERREIPLRPAAAPGTLLGNVTFPARGVWNVTVEVAGAPSPAVFSVEVFPHSSYIVESQAAQVDVYYAGEATLPIQIYDLRTMTLADAPADAVARLEKWTDDHTRKLNERTEKLAPTGKPGEVALETTLESGMYHVWVGAPSLGFDAGDRPYVHLYVLPEDAGSQSSQNETPALGALAALATFAGAALTARRRRE